MIDYGALSLLPPVLAIGLAVYTRQVYLSLAGGIFAGWTILAAWNPLLGATGTADALVRVMTDPGSASVLLFTFAIGGVIALVEANGGVRGFVAWVESRRWVTNARRAQLLAWLIGIVIFIESNITVLVTGSVCRPLFDRFKVSREKLAYLADSTSAPICVLVPFNAWGAYILGILATLGIENNVQVLIASIPFNVYPLAAIALAGFVAARGTNMGPMRAAEERTRDGQVQWPHAVSLGDPERLSPPPPEGIPLRARNMVLPMVTMVLLMPIAMYATGSGDITAGSGSTSVLWAVLGALLVAGVLSVSQRLLSLERTSDVTLQGAAALTGMALVLLLAIALGDVTRELGTGEYVAGLVAGRVPLPVLLPILFVVAAVIAFSTGSSWGTFAIMLPISVPIGISIGAPLAPFVAVALSGGIFGDHSSPISDTTIVASLASSSDHIEHVRTQLPYALLAGTVAIVAFAGVGLWLSA